MNRLNRVLKLLGVAWMARNALTTLAIIPILYGMARASTAMAVWVTFCSVAGVALEIVVPCLAYRAFQRWNRRQTQGS